MLRSRFMAVCFIALSLLFSSCATIVSKSVYQVDIRTEPSNAQIRIINKKGKEVFRGMSPATVPLKPGAGYFSKARYDVILSLRGHEERTVTLTAGLNGWYFGNILIGGALGLLIVDPLSGAMWKIKDPVVHETLTPLKGQAAAATTLKIMDIKDVPADMQDRLEKIETKAFAF